MMHGSGAPLCTVGFVSLGCAKNLVDAQIMAGCLLRDGIRLAPSPQEADIVIVNTCAFIGDAKQESIDHIIEVCRWKETGVCRGVIVSGCLSQRYGHELQESVPEVDAYIGLDEIDSIGDVVARIYGGEQGIVVVSPSAIRIFEPALPGLSLSGGPHAYLKVAEGCDHTCAFCAIPAIRGKHRSREQHAVLAEAEALLAGGAISELNIISQDITSYGKDLTNGVSLVTLLGALNGLDGDFWIRLLYGYPSGVSVELLDTMAASDKVCPYLDIPIQHSHPAMLRAMNRGGAADGLRRFVDLARTRVPGIVLRTTCLVGFPGETDVHFEHLCAFMEEMAFDHVGVFVFSPEEGTVAETMARRPSRKRAEQRRDELMGRQQRIVEKIQTARIGGRERVLLDDVFETEDGDVAWAGRTLREAPEVDGRVVVDGESEAMALGSFVEVQMIEANGYDMRGKVC